MPSNATAATADMRIIQLGAGQVGVAVVSIVRAMASTWQAQYGRRIRYFSLADSSGYVVPGVSEDMLGSETLARIHDTKASGQTLATLADHVPVKEGRDVIERAIRAAGAPDKVVVVDCAVGHETTELLLAAHAAGAHVVLCNKDPLTDTFQTFRALQSRSGYGSLHLSATVGAGLPISGVVAAAAASGDAVLGIQAVASGSLGHICTELSRGSTFPDALRGAIDAGFCEPDPRIDLSGHDVARKLLILARLSGYAAELADVAVESLIPRGADTLSREDFLAALPTWRDHLSERAAAARSSGTVLRYVGTMDADGKLLASLHHVSLRQPLAQGSGPDNVFELRTQRYQQHPLVIAGPGAGAAVTAGAVVADILRAAGVL